MYELGWSRYIGPREKLTPHLWSEHAKQDFPSLWPNKPLLCAWPPDTPTLANYITTADFNVIALSLLIKKLQRSPNLCVTRSSPISHQDTCHFCDFNYATKCYILIRFVTYRTLPRLLIYLIPLFIYFEVSNMYLIYLQTNQNIW